jgi:hypothetical protein
MMLVSLNAGFIGRATCSATFFASRRAAFTIRPTEGGFGAAAVVMTAHLSVWTAMMRWRVRTAETAIAATVVFSTCSFERTTTIVVTACLCNATLSMCTTNMTGITTGVATAKLVVHAAFISIIGTMASRFATAVRYVRTSLAMRTARPIWEAVVIIGTALSSTQTAAMISNPTAFIVATLFALSAAFARLTTMS